jgi:hypothetical protein
MKRLLRFWMTGMVIAVLVGGALATAALAADQPTVTGYSNVQLWVDPEYDDPSLLVMMQGTILGATPPATVQFLVPTTAVMYSAGSIDTTGKYSGGPPSRVASSLPGWDLVSYTITTNTFRVEYYDDIIQGQPDKTIDYQFMTYLPITGLSVSIQQPLKATNFVVDPAGTASTDQEGFNIQTYTYDSLMAADSLPFHISYTKSDNSPSIQQNSSGAPSASTGSSGGLSSGALAGIIVVVVIIVGGGVFYLTQRSRPVTRADRRRRSGIPRRSSGGGAGRPANGTRQAGSTKQPAAGGGGGKFCTNCGAPFGDNAKFCRQCGTPRR